MTPLRSAAQIRNDLAAALEYQRRYASRPSEDPLVIQMRQSNEVEIARLNEELQQSLTGSLEISLDGQPVKDHRVTVPYLNRVLDSFQATYRAVFRGLAPESHSSRNETTLSVAGTAPGSFRVALSLPATQLQLTEDPTGDRALDVIVSLLSAAEKGTAEQVGREWAERHDEPAVRAMIRLSASLASSRGTTRVRLTEPSGTQRFVRVTANRARDLAAALAGQTGREVTTVTGHLEMAQDRPPRVRVRTTDDEYLASVTDELLDRVKSLLFDMVSVTLVIDTRTSATTGSPDVGIELFDLEPAIVESEF